MGPVGQSFGVGGASENALVQQGHECFVGGDQPVAATVLEHDLRQGLACLRKGSGIITSLFDQRQEQFEVVLVCLIVGSTAEMGQVQGRYDRVEMVVEIRDVSLFKEHKT